MLTLLREALGDNWLAWLYQYGLGGLFFAGTLWLGARSRAVDPRGGAGRRLILALAAGFALFAGLHAAWIAAVEGPPGARDRAAAARATER